MPIPISADPDARAECPRCFALVRVARWREHDAWDLAITGRLRAVEDAQREPAAAEPQLVDWPDEPEPTPAGPAGPYAAEGPSL